MGEAAREAVPALVACLEEASSSENWVRLEAAVALWRIEHRVDRALPALIGLLQDPGPAVAIPSIVTRAAEALGEMGARARAAVPLLRQAAEGDVRPSVRSDLYPTEDLIKDDAFLLAIAEALWRIEGEPRA
jgi:HEAT repeat protein